MKRIALVEDNADNRLLVRAILQGSYDIDEYDNGAAAIVGCRAKVPDLILLDISLPGMDGLEVLRQIRSDTLLGRLPVIALTAHAMAADRDRFMRAGFDQYIAKPITSEEELLGAITKLLE